MHWRSLLVASEAFQSKLQTDVNKGLHAHRELEWIKESEDAEIEETKSGDFWD